MMAVNDIFKLAFLHTQPATTGTSVTTLHYRQTEQVTALVGNLLVQDVIDAWQDSAQPEYLTSLPDVTTLNVIQVRGITNPQFGTDQAVGLAGGIDDGGLGIISPRSAPVVSLRTGLIGRSFRGRSFLMSPTENLTANGVMVTALIENIDDYYNAALQITGPVSGNVYRMTIFSKTLSTEESLVDNLVTNFIIRANTGSQRKRRSVG
jgi:hypothetical protein